MGKRLKAKRNRVKGKTPEKDKHHRKPRSLGGTDDQSNLSLVSKVLHQAWHLLFGNKNPFQIARIINRVWLDPKYKFVVCERAPKYSKYSDEDVLKIQMRLLDAHKTVVGTDISAARLMSDTNKFMETHILPQYAAKIFES